MEYIVNPETDQIAHSSNGEWGASYVESSGEFPGGDPVFKSPWREATQEEIDAYLLAQAKNDKLNELGEKYVAFSGAGFAYDSDLFNLCDCGIKNVCWKDNDLPADAPNRFKFCTIENEPHDFENETAFRAFKEALMTEKDRIMFEKYNPYKVQIRNCLTVAAVESVVIDFSA